MMNVCYMLIVLAVLSFVLLLLNSGSTLKTVKRDVMLLAFVALVTLAIVHVIGGFPTNKFDAICTGVPDCREWPDNARIVEN